MNNVIPWPKPVSVLVQGKCGRPWRARLLSVGPQHIPQWLSADQCLVQPTESGTGWATQPLVVRKTVCTHEDGRAVL